ncbi:MAG: leucyl aminopeptidase [Actinomycetota bacterium]
MPSFKITTDKPARIDCDVLAVPVYKGGEAGPGGAEIERKLGTTFKELLDGARLKGEAGDALAVPTLGKLPAKQVLLVGIGEKGSNGNAGRKAGAVVARRTGAAAKVATTVPHAVKGKASDATGAFVEGYLLAAYRFDRYKNGDGRTSKTKEVRILAVGRNAGGIDVKRRVDRASVLAEATSLARDLTNTPAGDFYPESFAKEARRIAKGLPLTVRVLTEKELHAGKYGGILGVGQGSARPPRLVEIRYRPAGAKRHVALVGKGITFDSGGINLKSDGLDWMKMDMAGGAAVLGAMLAVGKLKPKVNVTALICSAENMPGGDALRPGDVITMKGGKTVEIGNTDAEGRIVMADGITYAIANKADVVVDIATLTGACMIALGDKAFGVFGNRQDDVDAMLKAAADAGEKAWQLPLYDEYRRQIDSEIADLKNIGNRYGGAITAALFLKEFAGETPWMHLDIAGPARSTADEFETPKGATGVGVRTLVRWLESL